MEAISDLALSGKFSAKLVSPRKTGRKPKRFNPTFSSLSSFLRTSYFLVDLSSFFFHEFIRPFRHKEIKTNTSQQKPNPAGAAGYEHDNICLKAK